MKINPFKVGDKVTPLVSSHDTCGKEYIVEAVSSYCSIRLNDGFWYNCESFLAVIDQPAPVVKASNPKEAIGASKLNLALVPDTLVAYAASAFYEGASKYGAYNWRVAGVRASTYIAAERRHVNKWWNGQNEDPKTRVHHLANAIACLGIVLDAELKGMLNDDRPPAIDLDGLTEKLAETQAHLAKMHEGMNPHHCTEADNAKP